MRFINRSFSYLRLFIDIISYRARCTVTVTVLIIISINILAVILLSVLVGLQEHMIVLTRTTGQKLLFEGRHEQAVPAAMQSLRFAIDVHGLASIELVPSYLILGEASIGMNAELI